MSEYDPVSVSADEKLLYIIASDRDLYLQSNSEATADDYNAALRVLDLQNERRVARNVDISTFVGLPELPEQAAFEIYERILEEEKRLITPHHTVSEYGTGTATFPDELFVYDVQNSSILLTAEHATSPLPTTNRSGADMGTGGLASVLAQDTSANMIVPIGRQTRDEYLGSGHATKIEVARRLVRSSRFISLHGMTDGKVLSVIDDTEIDAIIGLGANPNEQSIDHALKVKKLAKELLGLHVILGEQEYMIFTGTPSVLKTTEDGQPLKRTLNALSSQSMVSFAYSFLRNTTTDKIIAQAELTRLLRLLPPEMDNRDNKTKVMGVYLGYLFMKLVLETNAS